MDWIEAAGGLRGGLREGLEGDREGDSIRIGGFGIGDADVTIWRGEDGVVDSELEECQGSRGVPPQYIIVFSLSVAGDPVRLVLPYSALVAFLPFAHWGLLSSLPTAPVFSMGERAG